MIELSSKSNKITIIVNQNKKINIILYTYREDLSRQSQKSSLCSTDCTQIKPYLYLSGDLVARNKEQLIEHNITHIFNVAHTVCPNYFIDDGRFEYISFELVDNAAEFIAILVSTRKQHTLHITGIPIHSNANCVSNLE